MSFALFLAASLGGASLAQTCDPSWVEGQFPVPGIAGGFFQSVNALTVFDDGTGPALFAAGDFAIAGTNHLNNVARWDGRRWSRLGNGTNGPVQALAVFDDGTGLALYAGGSFTMAGGQVARGLARWNGSEWSEVGSGVDGAIAALLVFDDGSGPALVAGGQFRMAGGQAAASIARWNGHSFAPLGGGTSGEVLALASFDDGRGPTLYAGGEFASMDGRSGSNIAGWRGQTWLSSFGGTSGPVSSLAVYDPGTGPALYVAGQFTTAGGLTARSIARFDGRSWAPLGSGMNGVRRGGGVLALLVDTEGAHSSLIAAGGFSTAGGVASNCIARWNGSAWAPIGEGVGPVCHSLAKFDDGSGPLYYAGGSFTGASGTATVLLERWNGIAWSATAGGLNGAIYALAVYDDGRGSALYAGGGFTQTPDTAANGIARFDGTRWSPLGTAVGPTNSGVVFSLATFDDGTGPALYAGGTFTSLGGVPANRVARWNGSRWSSLGSGVTGGSAVTLVNALAVFDDGTGPALYAAGDFSTAGGRPASGIARWRNGSWTAVGQGMTPTSLVQALAVHDDGSGVALYAAGYLQTADGAARNLARWNGSAWSSVGSGINDTVFALASVRENGRRVLYAGGGFTRAGDAPALSIARWDGTSWSAPGGGLTDSTVFALAEFDDGGGPALYVSYARVQPDRRVYRVVKWDGSAYVRLGDLPLNGIAFALGSYDDGRGAALYAGGDFLTAEDVVTSRLARWQALSPSVTASPDSQVVCEGGAVRFDVTAYGSNHLSYQWRKDGAILPGETKRFLRIDSLAAADAGVYDVIVTNACGAVTSAAATLTVEPLTAPREGNVNARLGATANVLFANGSAGSGAERRVDVARRTRLTLRLDAPPSRPAGPAAYAIYAWRGAPGCHTMQALPSGIGVIAMPTPAGPGTPGPARIANTIGDTATWGVTHWPVALAPAPFVLADSARGIPRAATFYLQGIVEDAGAPQGSIAITNGVLVVAQ
jgi:hypothetical protein